MKKILPFLFLSVILFSCEKLCNKKEKGNLTYYTEDYKGKTFSILGVNAANIDALWVEFYNDDNSKEYNKYSLIVKSNGNFQKENGTCIIDWQNQITFNPPSATPYIGTWVSGKSKYKVQYVFGAKPAELNFIYKETK